MPCENCTCGAATGRLSESVPISRPNGSARDAELHEAQQRASRAEALLAEIYNSKIGITNPGAPMRRIDPKELRSKKWFNNSHNVGMTALYLERYCNFGLTREELQDFDRPIIGIAQTGSDLSPCNRHHMELAKRVADGIREMGAVPLEFPAHPIQETGKRPTACLDRNLSYLGLVEIIHGYPLDGVVFLTGCDKTGPACAMAAATMNIPSICLNVGPMLNGYWEKELTGSGTIVWRSRERHARGDINYEQFMDIVASSAPSTGHCNTMGTASTMNALLEALGLSIPNQASIPAPYRERQQAAYHTGKTIVEMVWSDRKPSDILTREAFENAIAINSAIGGSTNAPIHLNAVARHMGVPLSNDDWERVGYELPLLVNIQPAGEWLCEEYHRAGGLPAVVAELLRSGLLPHPEALTANGKSIGENCRGKFTWDRRIIKTCDEPLMKSAGFLNLKGTLFDSAIMKTSVINDEFRNRYLSDPKDPMAFEGPCVVFDGPEDYHARIDDPKLNLTDRTIMIMRGAGPLGYPGAAEVVNMQPSSKLIRSGVTSLPCVGDGRQSGTSGTPSILNASPEAAAHGHLAIVRDGDRVRIDLLKRMADILLSDEEIQTRMKELEAKGGYPRPESQTPWQEIFHNTVGQLNEGMVLEFATKYQRVAQTYGVPRDNH